MCRRFRGATWSTKDLLRCLEVLLYQLRVAAHQGLHDVLGTVGYLKWTVYHAVEVQALALVKVEADSEEVLRLVGTYLRGSQDWVLGNLNWLGCCSPRVFDPLMVSYQRTELGVKVDGVISKSVRARRSSSWRLHYVGRLGNLSLPRTKRRLGLQVARSLVQTIPVEKVVALVTFLSFLIINSLDLKLCILK